MRRVRGPLSISLPFVPSSQITALVALLVCAVLVASSAFAQDPVKIFKFKVCQDPNNMPYSNANGEGIENKIAEVFAKKLSVPLEYFSFPQRLAFVRNTIRYKLPGEEYRCDVMLNVPKRFGQLATTNTFYRSTYALVYPKGSKLDGIKSGEEFLAKAKDLVGVKRLGIHDKSPASAWLSKHNLTQLARPYPMMSPHPDAYAGQIIDKELAGGTVDAAIVWGPIAGYYARQVKDPQLVVVPLRSEPGVKFDYEMAMGVRYGEPQWRKQIQNLIDTSGPELKKILTDFGVPLVDKLGEPISAAKGSTAVAASQMNAPKTAPKSAPKTAPKTYATALASQHAAQQKAAAAKRAEAQVAMKEAAQEKVVAAEQAKQAAVIEQAAAKKSAEKAAAAKAAAVKAAAPARPAGNTGAASLYSVKDGYLVDANTYSGFKTWRAAACDRCHGANQQGLVGPSLLDSMKVLSKEEFIVTVRDGRLTKGMQSFGNNKKVMANIDHLYAYLKGRSDGAITRAKVKPIAQ